MLVVVMYLPKETKGKYHASSRLEATSRRGSRKQSVNASVKVGNDIVKDVITTSVARKD